MKTLFTALAAIGAFVAALLWYKASEVHPADDKSVVVFGNGDHRWDAIRTAELQSKWNRRAALAASLAAVLQGISLALPGDAA